MFRISFDLFVQNFRNMWLQFVNFSESCHFLKLSPPYLLEITIVVLEKKSKKNTKASKMHFSKHFPKLVILYIFCEIWTLTPSFFGTPLKSYKTIFSHQSMQENWLILWIFYVFVSYVCYAFVRVCLYVPCVHLLLKG